MIFNGGDTEGLFRGAIMQSGGPTSLGHIEEGQADFDFFVKNVGCSEALDTLSCLRNATGKAIQDAVNETPNIFSYQVCNMYSSQALTFLPMSAVLESRLAPACGWDLLY
jgi:acetylcholinesterase